ncbi:hypothetical protein GCM10008931_34040 [Oceanobacillus oncorhynchi subsp. oncorhynchi]|uniref:hypothetical protein n=1 Tax=Oceanobacillus oncorhynchi TaxID=545501 RepID=UPI0031DD0F1F
MAGETLIKMKLHSAGGLCGVIWDKQSFLSSVVTIKSGVLGNRVHAVYLLFPDAPHWQVNCTSFFQDVIEVILSHSLSL